MKEFIHHLKFILSWHQSKLMTSILVLIACWVNQQFFAGEHVFSLAIIVFFITRMSLHSNRKFTKDMKYKHPISWDFYASLPISRSSVKLLMGLNFLASAFPGFVILCLLFKNGFLNDFFPLGEDIKNLPMFFMVLSLLTLLLVNDLKVNLSAPYDQSSIDFFKRQLVTIPFTIIWWLFSSAVWLYDLPFGLKVCLTCLPLIWIQIIEQFRSINDEKLSCLSSSKLAKTTLVNVVATLVFASVMFPMFEMMGIQKIVLFEFKHPNNAELFKIIKEDDVKAMQTYLAQNKIVDVKRKFEILSTSYRLDFLDLNISMIMAHGSLMSYAAYYNSNGLVLYLHNKGFSTEDEFCLVSYPCQKLNALTIATMKDNLYLVNYFIAQGLNPNLPFKDGKYLRYPIQIAVKKIGCDNKLTRMLTNSSTINLNVVDNKGDSPLMNAIANHCPVMGSIIIGRGADLTVKNKQGQDFRDYAEKYKSPELIKFADRYHGRLPANSNWLDGLPAKKE